MEVATSDYLYMVLSRATVTTKWTGGGDQGDPFQPAGGAELNVARAIRVDDIWGYRFLT
jgi:hypothetical protein